MVSSFEPHRITCNVVNPKNTPPIWGCFIPPISGQIGGSLLLALPHYMDRNAHQQTSKLGGRKIMGWPKIFGTWPSLGAKPAIDKHW